jgi:hypothetical protein
MATYGSASIAARICVDQIVDRRTYLQYFGVPIRNYSYVFGDSKTVIMVLVLHILSYTNIINDHNF